MATEQISELLSLAAGEDLSAKQFYGLKLSVSSRDTVVLPNAVNQVFFGVLQNDPTSGQAAQIATRSGDISKIISRGDVATIAIGDRLTLHSDGTFVKAQTDGQNFAGIAMQASTSSGNLINMLIQPGMSGA